MTLTTTKNCWNVEYDRYAARLRNAAEQDLPLLCLHCWVARITVALQQTHQLSHVEVFCKDCRFVMGTAAHSALLSFIYEREREDATEQESLRKQGDWQEASVLSPPTRTSARNSSDSKEVGVERILLISVCLQNERYSLQQSLLRCIDAC